MFLKVLFFISLTSLSFTSTEDVGSETSSWSHTFSHYCYSLTNPEIEKQKFPDITLSNLLNIQGTTNNFVPISPEDKNSKTIYKRAFPFTTGTKSTSTFYDGYWYIKEIDFGNVHHAFLGFDQGFSSSATYQSLTHCKTAYEFISDLSKNHISCSTHKNKPMKDEQGKTTIEILLHTSPAGDQYIKLVIGRFRKTDMAYLSRFETKNSVSS